jgi:hypothetical protein
MHIVLDGVEQVGATAWEITDGILDVLAGEVVMFSRSKGAWKEIERILDEGEDWSMFTANKDSGSPAQAGDVADAVLQGIPTFD